MINFSFKKITDLLILIISLAIAFFVPFYFAVFVKTNNVFELNKIILFNILVLVLLMLTLIKLFFYKSDYYFGSLRELFKNYSYLLIILFFLFLAVVTLNSIDLSLSFYGDYFRQQGLISYIYFLLFFFLILANVNVREHIRRIIWAIVLAGALVSVYGLVQAGGHDPLSWIESTQPRVTSTFGQPNNLGSWLLFSLPLSLFLLVKTKRIPVKIAVFIITVMQVLTLIYSYSTSSWLGLIGGAIITLLIYLFFKFKILAREVGDRQVKRKKRKFIFISALFIILVAFIFSYFSTSHVFISRVKNLVNLQTGSTSARLQLWQAAWQGIKERPWLGYGLETQQEVLVKYYESDWAVPSNVNVRPSRAHNLFLDILLTQGIVGLVAYLALLYLFFKTLLLNIKQKKQRLLNYCILLSLISYLIYLQFNFHYITALVYFWLYLALAIIIQQQRADVTRPYGRGAYAGLVILIVIIGAGIICQINKQFKILIADHYFFEIRNSRQYNQYFAAIDLYNEIKKIIPRYSYYDQEFGVIMSDWVEAFKDPRFRQYGEVKLEEILAQTPNNTYSNFFTKAKIYTALANDDREDYYDRAEEYYQKLITISPNMPKLYREAANMYLKQGEYDLAIVNYNLALSKLPSLGSYGLNTTHKNRIINEMNLNYKGLASAYEALDNEEKAEEYKQKVLELD